MQITLFFFVKGKEKNIVLSEAGCLQRKNIGQNCNAKKKRVVEGLQKKEFQENNFRYNQAKIKINLMINEL